MVDVGVFVGFLVGVGVGDFVGVGVFVGVDVVVGDGEFVGDGDGVFVFFICCLKDDAGDPTDCSVCCGNA